MEFQPHTGGSNLSPPKPPLAGGNKARHGVKYRAYSDEDMRKAAHAILHEGMSLRRASVAFNVPKTTLAERLGDKRPRLPPRGAGAGAATETATATTTGLGGENGGSNRSKKPFSPPLSVPPATRYTWTEAEMDQAVEAVQVGGETVREAARRFGVPPSCLNSRARGRQPRDLKGELSRLTLKQESLLADWASAQAALGFPPSKDEVYGLAERVMRKGGENKKLGKQWIVHWMRRWPNVEVLDWQSKRAEKKRVPDLFDESHFAVIGDEVQFHQAPTG